MQPGISTELRNHHRYELSLPVRFAVLPEHADQIIYRIGPPSGEQQADLINIGRNGLAFMTNAFIPSNARILARIYNLGDDGGTPILAGQARVRRIRMTDGRPGYLAGARFTDESVAFTRDLHVLLARAEGHPNLAANADHAPPRQSGGRP